jgi:hypothetical protein
MEEGKIANFGQFGATERSPSYKNACATLSNTLLAWGMGSICPLVNQPVVLLVQLNVREYGRR